ncbi:PhaM family polyhydroxyalkanoate granule multifunctional regulatory protein [Burkholderia sp. TSV86]|uniref:PhaM family polyhydroxyalkanoate granule multifunctional regulatory protein n=1 Tax=Burkholderia sp. TSV86 TaxID=1385594 RepID=UPI000752081F|nr:PhaM family polyhydroxyalkanoate granule multifunctional regulatory protein [Burkholderia sp. TSV86]KVE33435.1 transcriptional regulator [Burkholderia sp. TSV86]
MTDTTGSNPFSGFGGFQPAGFVDKMWDMMRLAPFGGIGAFPGAPQGMPPSLSAMSDLMAPLASVDELDKRITDLRAVEQWLKLNLGMLQSAIQALEVQRATLATLRAFGAFAQTSMSAAEAALSPDKHASRESPAAESPKASTSIWRDTGTSAQADSSAARGASAADAPADTPAGASASDDAAKPPPGAEAFDPAGWWNLLQSQFDQLARFAMSQPGFAPPAGAPGSQSAAEKPAAARKKPVTRRAAAPRAPAAQQTDSSARAKPAAAKKAAKRGA